MRPQSTQSGRTNSRYGSIQHSKALSRTLPYKTHKHSILHNGFQTVLKQVGILLVEGSILASATLYGFVEMSGTGESQTRLVIVWVLNSADGNTIGTLRQDNTVAMMS